VLTEVNMVRKHLVVSESYHNIFSDYSVDVGISMQHLLEEILDDSPIFKKMKRAISK